MFWVRLNQLNVQQSFPTYYCCLSQTPFGSMQLSLVHLCYFVAEAGLERTTLRSKVDSMLNTIELKISFSTVCNRILVKYHLDVVTLQGQWLCQVLICFA